MALNSQVANRMYKISLEFNAGTFTHDVKMATDSLKGFRTVSGGKSGLNPADMARFGAGAATIGKHFRAMPGAVNTVTTSIKGMGLAIAGALGVVGLISRATSALVGFFTTGIKGAVDLNETMNKTNETFGESTSVVTDMAEGLASKFGLVKGPILDAAASFGLMAQGAGLSKSAAAAMSVQMTTLAADVTSFFNLPMEESLQKLKSGLAGEAEPLRSLGVLLSESAVANEALALGLAKSKNEIDDQAKVMARASLITKGLATASGDMARTSGGTALQFVKAGGGIKNFATSIGTLLLPAVNTATTAFNDLLASILAGFEENKEAIQGWADTITGIFDTVSVMLRNSGDVWEIYKLNTIGRLSNIMAYVITIPANLGILAEYVQGNWREMIETGINAVVTNFKNLHTNIVNLASALVKWLQDPTKGFVFNWTPMFEGFKSTVAKLPEFVKPALMDVDEEIAAVGERMAAREAARAKGPAGPAGKKPAPAKEKPPAKPAEYKGVAAVELGSAEAGSAIARFMNQAGGTEAKQTAAATKETAKHTKNMAQALREIGKRSGRPVEMNEFTF